MVKIIFVHPDLGIGGAERLVVDAAMALKKNGHTVSFITAHHDSNHCFKETINGDLDVIVAGDWLPRSTLWKFYAFWAYLRMIYVSIYLVFCSGIQYDVAFVDQISACIPFLRLNRQTKIIFYCHYPDQLLTQRQTMMKSFYRYFMDTIEEYTTKLADRVLVNSKFTRQVFQDTFASIIKLPDVLYPSINLEVFDAVSSCNTLQMKDKTVFLSLNRYERKKNIKLCLDALKDLQNTICSSDFQNVHLVIAGGYDDRVNENIEYYNELTAYCQQLDLQDHVSFLKSPSNEIKISLLKEATCLLYTPEKEHFGIVPIEAMYVGTPVIAVNSGGPLETVIDGKTGFLRHQNASEFSHVMKGFVDGSFTKSSLGKVARQHVLKNFSYTKFSEDLDQIVNTLQNKKDL